MRSSRSGRSLRRRNCWTCDEAQPRHAPFGVKMFWLKAFWRTVVATTTWLGILYFAKDINELPGAVGAWVPLLPSQENLLIIFSGALVTWIFWFDVRPFVKEARLFSMWSGQQGSSKDRQMLMKEGRRLREEQQRNDRRKVALALDDLYAEGVSHRNRLQHETKQFQLEQENKVFLDWNDRALNAMKNEYVNVRYYSLFRTLNQFPQKYEPYPGKIPAQAHLESMWNEKLCRLLQVINDDVGKVA